MTDIQQIVSRLSDGEKARLIMGRTDWPEDKWQDHCGLIGCEHCSGWIDVHVAPNLLSDTDKAVRAHLMKEPQ